MITYNNTLGNSQLDSLTILKKANYLLEKSELYWPQSIDSTIYYTNEAAKLYKSINKKELWLECISGIANAYYIDMDYKMAIFKYDELEREFENLKFIPPKSKKRILTHLGSYKRMLKDFNKSIYYLKESASIKDVNLDMSTYANLGFTYYLLGDYNKAESHFLNSLNYDIDKINELNVNIFGTLGNLYQRKNNHNLAINYYFKILYFYDSNIELKKGNQTYFKYKIKLAESYLKLNKNSESKSILKELEFSTLNKFNSLRYKFILSKFLIKNDQNDLAINNIKLALKSIDYLKYDNEIKILQASFLNLLTIENIKKKNYNELIKINNEGINLFNLDLQSDLAKNFNFVGNILLELLYTRIKIFKITESNKETFNLFNITISLIKSLRQQNSTASHKDFWANENLEIYQDAIGTFIHEKDINTAFTFAEENKSNLLIQSLNDIDAKTYAGIPEELLDEERELRAKLQFYQKKKFELENNDAIDSTKLLSYSEIITHTDFAIEAIVDTLESQYPEYYEIKYNEEDLTVNDVQELLDDKSAFIEYFIGKDSSYVFTITKNDIYVSPLENISEKSDVFLNYYNTLSEPSTSIDSLNYYSSEAYNLILKDAIKNLDSNITNLVIVPDDILNNLPFGMMKDIDQTSYIGSQYNIQYQYSGRLWRLLKNRKSEDKNYDLLAYAYNTENLNFLAERACATMEVGDLLCSEKEINIIANILKGKSINLSVNKKEDILNQASNAKVIHLATHSCLDSENSDYSKIFFDDGYITNIDLQLQQINADLAVLSACESGYGELVKGEGAMSISKGFFHAGVKSTLVSLWPVDDCSTSEFMKHFYTYLQEGDKKDIALKKAKQTYVETAHPSRTHPYYWAGFILIGDNAEVWSKDYGLIFWLLGAAVLVIIGGATLKKLTHKST